MHMLSKSVLLMFLFDFIILSITSIYTGYHLGLSYAGAMLTAGLIVTAGIITMFLKGHYKIREFNITKKNAYLLFEGVIFAHVPAALLLLILANWIFTLWFLVKNILIVYIFMYLYRAMFHYYLFYIKKPKNVLIVGTNKNAKLIAEEIINKKALKMNVAGFWEDNQPEDEMNFDTDLKVFRHSQDLKDIIKTEKIDIVIVAVTRRMEDTLLSKMVFGIPNRIKVYKMPDFYEMVTGKYFVDRMSINWLFYTYMNKRSYVYKFCKRAYDIIAASIILTVTFPILLYIAIRVKLTDGGNPVYTQMRIGRGGKHFKMYKLRTMYMNDYVPKEGKVADTGDQDKDDRVIPFCKFVRRARFDEIPQMINILKGEMSIVGPRTEWEDLVKIYSKEIPYYTCRQWVKTGWTGWAQINQGHCVLNDDIAEKLQYDLYYLKHRNVLWEIGILIKAVFLALGGRHG